MMLLHVLAITSTSESCARARKRVATTKAGAPLPYKKMHTIKSKSKHRSSGDPAMCADIVAGARTKSSNPAAAWTLTSLLLPAVALPSAARGSPLSFSARAAEEQSGAGGEGVSLSDASSTGCSQIESKWSATTWLSAGTPAFMASLQ